MKKHLHHYFSVIFICTISLFSNSQTAYTLVTSNEAYTSIPTTNLLNENNPDSIGNSPFTYALYQGVPIGFDFEFLGETFDSIRMSENGFIVFLNNGVQKGYISLFDCDLDNFMNDPNESPIYYSVEGTPGDRIFKCEIVNSGFANDPNDSFFANSQVWLYENCNDFEVRTGQSNSSPNMFWTNLNAPIIGYGSYVNNIQEYLIGNPLNPTLQQTPTSYLDNVPGSGMVYNFSNCTNNLEANSIKRSEVYPTLTKSSVTIRLNESYTHVEINIIGVQGNLMKKIETSNNVELIVSLDDFPNGLYLIQIVSENGFETHRIVKD